MTVVTILPPSIPVGRLASCCLLVVLLTPVAVSAQQTETPAKEADRASAYYHFSLAHLNMQRAKEFGRPEYIQKALDEYKLALEADPGSEFVRLELVKLYGRTSRLDEAVAEAEKLLARNPDSIETRRVLGTLFRSYGTDRSGTVDKEMLRRAVKEFEKLLEIDPKDTDALLELSSFYRMVEESEKAEQTLKRLLDIEPDSVEALTNLSHLYLGMGNTDAAIEALEKIKASGVADRRALATLGRAYENAGRHREAVEIFEKVVTMGGDTSALRHSLANNLVLSGQYDKALKAYEKLVSEEPRDPELQLRLSQIYRQKRRFEKAWDHLRRAAELAPDSLEVKYNSVLLYESEGKEDQAIEEMEKLLAETEKKSYTQREKRSRTIFLEQLGMLYRRQEKAPRATEVFEAMAKLDPDSRPRALVHIIETHRLIRDFDKALETSESAAGEFPDNRGLTMLRASVLADTGQAAEASKMLKRLLKGSRQDRDILLALAQVYQKGRQYDLAVKAAEDAAKHSESRSENLGVLFTLGSVLERAKRYDQAERKFRELIALDADNAPALNYLGYMLADLGHKLDEAHDMIQKALDFDPDNGAYLDSLGWLYYRQEKLELAARYLERSAEKVKRDPVVHTHLGDVYFKQGKISQAGEHWRRALEEWKTSAVADQDPKEIEKLRAKLSDLETRLSSRIQEKKP